MATFNVKNLPDVLYRKLKARAKRERRSVAQEVAHILTTVDRAHSGGRYRSGRAIIREAVARFGTDRLLSQAVYILVYVLDTGQLETFDQRAAEALAGDRDGYLWWKARLHGRQGRLALRRAYADSLRVLLEPPSARTRRTRRPDRNWPSPTLGLAGRRMPRARSNRLLADARGTSTERTAHAIRPPRCTPLSGADAAISHLQHLLSVPSFISVPGLRVDPTWAPLRSHPRFQRLVDSKGSP